MVSGGDPLQIAALEGLAAGSLDVLLAAIWSASWPTPTTVLDAGLVGFLGYGTSLVLVVLALRLLGTARTGAYFDRALVHDAHHQHPHAPGTPAGEPRSHPHVHAPLRHSHPHFPDLHHRHHH